MQPSLEEQWGLIKYFSKNSVIRKEISYFIKQQEPVLARDRKHNIHSALLLLLLSVVLIGCSTKKNTFTRRLYHNLTSHYNVYWNGRESLREGVEKLDEKAVDNYNEILTVFNYGTTSDAQSVNPQMDRAIQKASITIQKHSMVFHGEEKINWIDDAYMLIGKAYFYKQEYFSARRTFNFVIREYPENDIKWDAMIWLAHTYNQTEEFEKVEPLLNLIAKDVEEGLAPKEIAQTLPQLYADNYIRQGMHDDAIDFLYEAISYNPAHDLETRMLFILGQIFQKNGDLNRATNLYRQVIKKNPPYEMAFQAKINMATAFDASYADSREVRKLLRRMLKDDKNKEYLDQIYYALAEIDLKEGFVEDGINNLQLSVQESVSNNYQKAKSALRLADLYFEMPDYQNAQAYYDTAMMFLPKDYPDYNVLDRKAGVLSDLVVHLITIQHEDSLQKVAAMSESDRNELIDGIILAYEEELRRQEEEKALQDALQEQESLMAQSGTQSPGFQGGTPIGGGREWYFYNANTKSYGYNEFVKKWGKRKQEDLWRLRNKQLVTFGFDDPIAGAGSIADTTKADSVIAAEADPMKREYYLKGLPFTGEQVKASDEKIRKAYFELGRLYHDGLDDLAESRIAFETLNDRFPEHENLLRSWYYLFKIYEELGDKERQAHYKNLIINRFPDSDYAKVLQDPEYHLKQKQEEDKVAQFYEDTYQAYESGQYYMVIAKSELALATYGDTVQLAPKFEFLRAMSVGRVDVLDSLVSSLKNIIMKYPDSEIKTLASGILVKIIADHPEFADENFGAPGVEPVKKSPYNFRSGSMHMFMIIVESKFVRLNPLKVKISDYNQKYYSLENLSVNSVVLDKDHYLVTVGNFNNADKALKYFDAITRSEYVYSDLNPDHYQNFVISTENYPVFFKDKQIETYLEFYEKNYLKD